ncbi:MAG: lamin tail domain-containing protein [Actinobacteria bacterium]|nr:lamin tail domain-containing protein [Actinomycetota bacterium]
MRPLLAVIVALLAACGGPEGGPYELPASEAEQYVTAYIAAVVPDAGADDLQAGAGEHVVIRNNWDHRTDMGGWYIEDAAGDRLPLGIGRQIEPQAELRVHTGCGEDSEEAVYACLDEEVLDDDGDELTLRDSAGGEVARFAYGTAAS